MDAVYYDGFGGYGDLPYGADNPAPDEVVYAGYTYEAYDGSAIVVFVRDGQWFENHDGHCSCYGLENWKPETAMPEAVMKYEGWPGLAEAVQRKVDEMFAAQRRAELEATSTRRGIDLLM